MGRPTGKAHSTLNKTKPAIEDNLSMESMRERASFNAKSISMTAASRTAKSRAAAVWPRSKLRLNKISRNIGRLKFIRASGSKTPLKGKNRSAPRLMLERYIFNSSYAHSPLPI